jgi:RCC1 and BTB domain-containing protein
MFLFLYRVVEVAASHYTHISSAMTETGQVYMWGQCRGQSMMSLYPTKFSSTDEVFAAFASPPVTWRTYAIGK